MQELLQKSKSNYNVIKDALKYLKSENKVRICRAFNKKSGKYKTLIHWRIIGEII